MLDHCGSDSWAPLHPKKELVSLPATIGRVSLCHKVNGCYPSPWLSALGPAWSTPSMLTLRFFHAFQIYKPLHCDSRSALYKTLIGGLYTYSCNMLCCFIFLYLHLQASKWVTTVHCVSWLYIMVGKYLSADFNDKMIVICYITNVKNESKKKNCLCIIILFATMLFATLLLLLLHLLPYNDSVWYVLYVTLTPDRSSSVLCREISCYGQAVQGGSLVTSTFVVPHL